MECVIVAANILVFRGIPEGIYKKGNREEKSLRHIAMVAKFLDDNKLKIHLTLKK